MQAKGLPEVHGLGDSAFKAGTDQNCTLLMIKGTTILSILVGEPKAQDVCLAVAKIGASKM